MQDYRFGGRLLLRLEPPGESIRNLSQNGYGGGVGVSVGVGVVVVVVVAAIGFLHCCVVMSIWTLDALCCLYTFTP